MTRHGIRFRFVSMTALIGVVALTGLASGETAARPRVASAVTGGPVITGVACTKGELLMVTGEGFTPGGQVDVEIAGQDDLSAPRQPVFGPNGSLDPAVRYRSSSAADLGDANASAFYSVRASQSIFGPNGSLDPALGYQLGGSFGLAVDHDCTETAVVRAYDHQLAAWSEQLPVLAGMQLDN